MLQWLKGQQAQQEPCWAAQQAQALLETVLISPATSYDPSLFAKSDAPLSFVSSEQYYLVQVCVCVVCVCVVCVCVCVCVVCVCVCECVCVCVCVSVGVGVGVGVGVSVGVGVGVCVSVCV